MEAEGGALATEHTGEHAAGECASGVTRVPRRSAANTSAPNTGSANTSVPNTGAATISAPNTGAANATTANAGAPIAGAPNADTQHPAVAGTGPAHLSDGPLAALFKEEQCRSASADVAAWR